MEIKTLKGCIFAVISAVIYGCMPLMAKYIYADGVTSLTLVFLRNLFALIPLAVLAYRERKTLKIPLSVLPAVGFMSLLGVCLTPVLLFSSYNYIPSGLSTVLHFAYPTFVVLAEILFMRQKARLSSILSVVLCTVGIAMFYTPQQDFNLTGSALALLSAVAFAGYVVLLSHFDCSKLSGFSLTFYTTLIGGVATFCICIATNQLSLPTTAFGWGLSILFSLLVTLGAVVLFQKSTLLIGGECSSILSTLEPITSLLLGVIIFSEPFGLLTLLGTALVLAASIITVFFKMVKKMP